MTLPSVKFSCRYLSCRSNCEGVTGVGDLLRIGWKCPGSRQAMSQLLEYDLPVLTPKNISLYPTWSILQENLRLSRPVCWGLCIEPKLLAEMSRSHPQGSDELPLSCPCARAASTAQTVSPACFRLAF